MLSRLDNKSRLDQFLKECRSAYETVTGSISNDIRSKEDLELILNIMGRNPSRANMKYYWSKHTESVSFDEFCDYAGQEREVDENLLLRAFEQVDPNGDGFIERDELERVLLKYGERMTQSELKQLLDDFPYDDKGRFPFEEFCRKFADIIEECQSITKRTGAQNGVKERKNLSIKQPRPSKRSSSRLSITSLASIREQKPDEPPSPKISPRKSSTASLPRERSLSMTRKDSISSVKKSSSQTKLSIVEPKNLKLDVVKSRLLYILFKPITALAKELARVDLELFIFKEEDNEIKEYISCQNATIKGKYCVKTDLRSGKYRLIPYTSGCIFKQRSEESKSVAKLVKGSGEAAEITQAFIDALHHAFDSFDLDGNDLLNYEEFNNYYIRANDDECDLETWGHVTESYETKDGELTRAGFIAIHEQEALDNPDDVTELWFTLHGIGLNNSLVPDEICPFIVEIHTEDCEGHVETTSIRENADLLDRAVCANVVAKGTSKSISDLKDLQLWTYQTDTRASFVVLNQMKNPMAVKIDCSGSQNCISSIDDLKCNVKIKPEEATVGIHLMKENPTKDWSIVCYEELDQL
ncbi:uncharacterized protein TRIADDRAFT_59376 [Trichoplax adhaerens]|uniref:EF-hand domain-containing protein n=1 Tax=Trichoplax adhaerens TaxID=10228 RepID=B3S4X2_TRIAD|nr:hypothetical protein TRIADDRAFT_59376 [Trichoplax adhaerens]EDV22167.1 hypothetical protein TRIADDRAFT_59376 [Trichoplax adhaerens]|eukprot:XP_002115322.1 hypothetical protein TRIADDRAFT_59376 [Trichoplax adhaerens]